jgi:hypothetical protein
MGQKVLFLYETCALEWCHDAHSFSGASTYRENLSN